MTLNTACIFIVLILVVYSVDNGVGRTPPMGWTSSKAFGCDISEKVAQ